MYAINFGNQDWDAFVNRGCINGATPPAYTIGQNYISDLNEGATARIKMIGGSMRMPPRPRGESPRSLFFTYQNCAGVSTIAGKQRTASLVVWFQRPRGDTVWQLPRFATVKLELAPSLDPTSTIPRVVNVFSTSGLIASRVVPANGNMTLSLGKPVQIAAVEIQTNHIENNLKAALFMP